MSNTLTITGNLTADPELRHLDTGRATASLTVASTERYQDRETGEWKDGSTAFVRVVLWGDLAVHASDSLAKGSPVVVVGQLQTRKYETDGGERRSTTELHATEVARSLRYGPIRG